MQPKEMNGYMLSVSTDLINELIRGNIIANIFYPDGAEKAKIEANHYELEELGPWAFLKCYKKVNVLLDSNDSNNLEIFLKLRALSPAHPK